MKTSAPALYAFCKWFDVQPSKESSVYFIQNVKEGVGTYENVRATIELYIIQFNSYHSLNVELSDAHEMTKLFLRSCGK